jgi:hypothetical protein
MENSGMFEIGGAFKMRPVASQSSINGWLVPCNFQWNRKRKWGEDMDNAPACGVRCSQIMSGGGPPHSRRFAIILKRIVLVELHLLFLIAAAMATIFS